MQRVLKLSRQILDRAGIHVDDLDNLTWVSNAKGVHTIAKAKKVLGELYKVRNGSRIEVVDKLREIGDLWGRGLF